LIKMVFMVSITHPTLMVRVGIPIVLNRLIKMLLLLLPGKV
jgi:hypothetical protein